MWLSLLTKLDFDFRIGGMNTLLFFYLMFVMPILVVLRIARIIDISYWIIVAPALIPIAAVANVFFVLILLELA